jgi:hypothetical protein
VYVEGRRREEGGGRREEGGGIFKEVFQEPRGELDWTGKPPSDEVFALGCEQDRTVGDMGHAVTPPIVLIRIFIS